MKGLILFVALACLLHSVLGQWTLTAPQLRALPVSGIAADSKGNILVVQQYSENLFASWSTDNGTSWKPGYIPSTSQYFYGAAVYCVNDKFYITTSTYDSTSYLFTSTDAQNFTATSTNYAGYSAPILITTASGVLFGGVNYEGDAFMVSSDGITFSTNPLPDIEYVSSIYGVGNVFILVAYPTVISVDGVTFTNLSTISLFGDYYSLNFATGAGGSIVAIVNYYTQSTAFFVSTDSGNTFTQVNANLTGEVYAYSRSFVYAMGLYFSIIETPSNFNNPFSIEISTDLVQWKVVKSPSFYPYVPYFYAAGSVVIAYYSNGTFAVTTDGPDWITLNTGFYGYWEDIYVLADGSFVLQTNQYQFYSTVDGYNITALPAAPFPSVFGFFVSFTVWEQAGTFYFFEGNGTLFSTTNFKTWTTVQINFGDSLFAVETLINGNGVWVGVADLYNFADQKYYAFVMSTTDLTSGTWTTGLKSKPYTTNDFYSVTFGNGMFVLQLEGDIYTSKDGVTWVQPNPAYSTYYYSYLIFEGNLFFLSYSTGYFSVSPNASTWDYVYTWNYGNPSYDSNSQTYYSFYSYGYISTSSDGVTWNQDTSLTFPTADFSTYLTGVAFNGKVWLATDNMGSVYVNSA